MFFQKYVLMITFSYCSCYVMAEQVCHLALLLILLPCQSIMQLELATCGHKTYIQFVFVKRGMIEYWQRDHTSTVSKFQQHWWLW